MTIRFVADITSETAPHILIDQNGRTVKVEARPHSQSHRIWVQNSRANGFLRHSLDGSISLFNEGGAESTLEVMHKAALRLTSADLNALHHYTLAWHGRGLMRQQIENARLEVARAERNLARLEEKALKSIPEVAEHLAKAESMRVAA